MKKSLAYKECDKRKKIIVVNILFFIKYGFNLYFFFKNINQVSIGIEHILLWNFFLIMTNYILHKRYL